MTPQQYNVRGIPTLLIFKGGEVIAEKVGALPKSQLESWINQSIA
jgi:thioredoxin 1